MQKHFAINQEVKVIGGGHKNRGGFTKPPTPLDNLGVNVIFQCKNKGR